MAAMNFSFQQFSVSEDPSTVSQRWNKYIKRFNRYLESVKSCIADDRQKQALLLTLGGEELQDIWDNFPETLACGIPTLIEQRKLIPQTMCSRKNPQRFTRPPLKNHYISVATVEGIN